MQYIFRGLTADNKWVYGSLIQRVDGIGKLSLIEAQDKEGEITVWQVKDDSVGLYIGRKDKEDKLIFPGDIQMVKDRNREGITIVRWNSMSCKFEGTFLAPDGRWLDNGVSCGASSLSMYPVIGNVWDTPELLNPASGKAGDNYMLDPKEQTAAEGQEQAVESAAQDTAMEVTESAEATEE